jgi:hypothetical protein
MPLLVRFEERAARGTRKTALDDHAPAWRGAMRAVGDRMRESRVAAIVFVHGTFTGDDPLSAAKAVERALPQARSLARTLRRRTRATLERVLGDLGNFGTTYVRLFEAAIGGDVPCTAFTWSSENHHVGRLQGALDLAHVLATHADLAAPGSRVLVMGHSHAGQLFALATQLLARSVASEAILDVARARGLDVATLEHDLETLARCGIDFVTFGAPSRYAWARADGVRVLHVVHHREGSVAASDLVRRLGAAGSDLPALDGADRRANARLDDALGPGFAPGELVRSLRDGSALPASGEVALVDYGAERLGGILSSGLGHGVYTRLDAMLFHAELVTDRFYS